MTYTAVFCLISLLGVRHCEKSVKQKSEKKERIDVAVEVSFCGLSDLSTLIQENARDCVRKEDMLIK